MKQVKGKHGMTSEFAIAVHALVILSHRKTVVSSDVLAENICTNPTRVRKVLSRLKKAGMVETKEGAEGGYHLATAAAGIHLRAVADALDVAFVTAAWKSGNSEMSCLISSGMAGVLDELYADLDTKCREQLAGITIVDLEGQIFVQDL